MIVRNKLLIGLLAVLLLKTITIETVQFKSQIKVVRSGIETFFERNYHINFDQISESLKMQRQRSNGTTLEPSPFLGPEFLRKTMNQCRIHETDKYLYRICMFANITQHEKSRYHYHSFNGILGIWRDWYVRHDRFDFLLFDDGDECHPGLKRKAAIHLECSPDDTENDLFRVANLTEVKQCIYNVILRSSLFCELGTVYSHLDATGKMEWDLIHTLRVQNKLSEIEYKKYLRSILNNYGLKLLDDGQTSEQILLGQDLTMDNHIEKLKKCEQRVKELEKKFIH